MAAAHSVAIVGGGVAGLTLAYELLARSDRAVPAGSVVCLERSERPGGNILTDLVDGYVCEWGPNGFLDNVPATLDLVHRLGMDERLYPADAAAARRFIFRSGRLHEVSTSPLAFARSGVLTAGEKLRLVAEPFVPRRREEGDESVLSFATRRIGAGAARALVAAMVSGIYAGDAARLSVGATFPKLATLEREHGGLTRGMLANRRKRRRDPAQARGAKAGGPAGPGGQLTSFRTGMGELTAGLARAIGPALRTRSRVLRLDRADGGWRLQTEGGPPVLANAVVLSAPAWHAAEITAELDGELSDTLAAIPSAGVAVVHLGFRRDELAHPLHGFGFLVPRGEGLRILGALWASSIYPGRAPAGHVLVTCMAGGAHEPALVDLDDAGLVELARADLRTAMGITAAPRFLRIYRHARGIPQYTMGHLDRLATIDRCLARHTGLYVAGNSYRGISANACIDEAARLAPVIASSLRVGVA